jgi:hypothetical protein
MTGKAPADPVAEIVAKQFMEAVAEMEKLGLHRYSIMAGLDLAAETLRKAYRKLN